MSLAVERVSDGARSASVTMSPELRALYRSFKAGGAETVAPPAAASPESCPLRRLRLRRDGRRPLVFEGDLIACAVVSGLGGGARHEFALFISADGQVAARVALIPSGEGPGREVHSAGFVDGLASLGELLDDFEAEAAWPVSQTAALGADSCAVRSTLRTDFDAFSASVRRLAPTTDRRDRT
jgi:hypothetical protein